MDLVIGIHDVCMTAVMAVEYSITEKFYGSRRLRVLWCFLKPSATGGHI